MTGDTRPDMRTWIPAVRDRASRDVPPSMRMLIQEPVRDRTSRDVPPLRT